MSLQGIDIASHQKGLDISRVNCDFAIVKATQGIGYVNPYCAEWVEGALARGLCVGIYHYIGGVDAAGEMRYFWENCSNWNGRVMWCLDWESYQNRAWGDEGYLERCIREIAALTGRPPMVYASASVFPHAVCERNNCGKWVAQYASNDQTGYQESPWNEGAYSCAIRQYTSNGRITGWGGPLDLNKFYGDRAAWAAYAGSEEGEDMTPDQSAKLDEIHHMLTRTDDPTGRGMENNLYTHVKWIAASVSYCSALLKEICTELEIDMDNVGPSEHT